MNSRSDVRPEGASDIQAQDWSQPDAANEHSILEQYLRIALRWRWVIGGIIAGVILLGLIITLLMTPLYTATATIEISREADQVTNFEGVENEVSVADNEFYETQYGLLEARSLAERVASDLNLINDPEFFEQFGTGDPSLAGFGQVSGRYTAEGAAVRRQVAGEILLQYINISPTRFSRLVDISFTSPNPVLSARVANSWAEAFITSNLERKAQSTTYGRDVLRRQLTEYKQRLDESQRQLVAYAADEEIINLPAAAEGQQERSIVADNLSTLNAELAQAQSARIQAEARYRQAGGAGSSAQALTNSTINSLRQRRAELAARYQELMATFEPGYPQAQAIERQIESLDAAISREEARVSDSLQAEYRQAVERESQLARRVEQLKDDFLDLRTRSIQYNIYQQEVDTNQALYDGLLQRFNEIGVAGGVGVNNVAVVDTAEVPEEPSSPQLILNLLIATLIGTILGAAIALLLEQLDQSVGDPEVLQRRLGLPLLGTVPRTKLESPEEDLLDRKSDLVEAYLAIQTNLGFTTQHGVPKAFAVTSTRAAEGKSTTSLALAASIARAGRKVILVDGDMRSPSVHHLAGVSHDNGLSNYLSGEDSLDGMITSMDDLNIDVMNAGPIPPNAGDLLLGDRLRQLIDRLLETYDHVVVDSPPVLGLADAPLIGSQVGGVIYVVESHGIRTGQVKTAIARLASARVRLLGGVVTKFDLRKANYGYKYDYGYGYGKNDADAAAA